jgi:thioredoxin-related protein
MHRFATGMVKELKFCVVLCLGIFVLSACHKNTPTLELPQFSKTELGTYNILFFVSADCPLCKAYTSVIKSMGDSLDNKWKVFVVRTDVANSNGFVKGEFGLETGDSSGILKQSLGATVTPEVFIVSKQSTVLYHGAIDNYAWKTGKHRTKATVHYLANAIAQINESGYSKSKFQQPIGCYIE